jgi:hypothetical protein
MTHQAAADEARAARDESFHGISDLRLQISDWHIAPIPDFYALFFN